MINKKQVVRHFSRRSASYDEHAIVQKHMAISLQTLLSKTGTFNHILEIGCGTGRLTRILASIYPQAQILATDISPGMLTVAQANLAEFRNIRYAVEDGENLRTQETFDLIVSNAAFQWFSHHEQAFHSFFNRLSANGYLVYATLGPKTFYELHQSFQNAHKILDLRCNTRHGQRFTDAAQLEHSMEGAGFQEIVHTEEEMREYFPTAKDFLWAVKKIGANNTAYPSHAPVNRQLLLTMMRCYEQNFQEQGHIHATYHAIYGLGRKP